MRPGRLSAGLVLWLALAACTAEQPARQGDGPPGVIVPGRPGEPVSTVPWDRAGEVVPDAKPNDADFRYVRMMISHHEQALRMTELAATRAERADVRALASRIADTQGPEIQAMNAWLTKVGAPPPQPGHGHGGGTSTPDTPMPGMVTPQQLDALRAAGGAAFDRMFLELMTAHHEGALEMAGDVLQTGADVFVEEMAKDVVATQEKEIRRMRAMLAS